MTQHINITEDFSPMPISRYRKDSKNSEEAFRGDFLRPKVEQAIRDNEVLKFDFNEIRGLTASFLKEAFGGLVRNCNAMSLATESTLKTLHFQPAENRLFHTYIKNVKQYIQEAIKQ